MQASLSARVSSEALDPVQAGASLDHRSGGGFVHRDASGSGLQTMPVSFDGCFGWLHLPASGPGASAAVLLCPGFGMDALTGHRPLRHLALALAHAGYPTLRFAYPSTGDSCDRPQDDPLDAWLGSIHAAAGFLRAQTGAGNLVFGGLRLGATLAMLAAQDRDDIAALMLLAPALRGQAYVSAMKMELSIKGIQQPGDGSLEHHEMRLPKATLQRLRGIELGRLNPLPGCAVGVFAPEPSPVLTAATQAWRAAGAAVTEGGFDGLAPLLRPCFMNHEANLDPEAVVAWLRAAASVVATQPPVGTAEERNLPLRPPGCHETPVFFGAGRHLFGMLCEPDASPVSDIAVLIVNAGGTPHFADGRQAVSLARRLAARGIVSLRMDFAGMGDSTTPGPDPEAPTHIMDLDRAPEIAAALDALEQRGFRRFALSGLCSGAYNALHGAVDDARVDALLLINLPTFTWRCGDRVEEIRTTKPATYLRRLTERDAWARLLTGRSGLTDLSHWLRSRATVWSRRAHQALMAPLGGRRTHGTAHRVMAALAHRHVACLLLYADGDPGVLALEQDFGPRGRDLASSATVRILAGLDHALTTVPVRRAVENELIAFLEGRLAPVILTSANPATAPHLRLVSAT